MRFTLLLFLLFTASKMISQTDSLQVVNSVPIYPGCEKHDSQEKLKKCMSNKVIRHINKNFNLDVFYEEDIPKGRYKIVTAFKIDAQGNIEL